MERALPHGAPTTNERVLRVIPTVRFLRSVDLEPLVPDGPVGVSTDTDRAGVGSGRTD